jgi:hypothetical protein
MSASTEFVASLPFLGYQQRNAVLDNFFYDTGSLTVQEKAKLTPLVDREGSIIVVPPSNSDRQIRYYKSALRFMNKEGPTIRAIAVAGVGSSALGTAALARNIADALDTDVAGIITGYGLSDVMTEALGGWFAFGAADRIRYAMEKFLERMRSATPADGVPGDNDVATLSEILLAGPPALEYLVAHSKGSLTASYALQQYVEDLEGDDSPLFERLRIITLGAVVGLPSAFNNVKQYLGALDWFGGANSSLGVMHERIPGVSHHLNPGFPYHMSVAALLNGGNGSVAPRLLPKPPLEAMLAPFSIPRAEAPELEPVPMPAAKEKEPVRKPTKKMATPATEVPKAASAAPKAASPEPKLAGAAPKVATAAPKVASTATKAPSTAPKVVTPAPKVAGAAPKAQAAEVNRPSVAPKPAIKPAPKKAAEAPREPLKAPKAKTIAANGKLTLKKSKKGVR